MQTILPGFEPNAPRQRACPRYGECRSRSHREQAYSERMSERAKAMAERSSWLIDEPSPAAPIEVLEQWLFDCDIKIENAKDDGEREAGT